MFLSLNTKCPIFGLILFAFILSSSTSLYAQEKRFIGRIDGKKLYLMEHKTSDGDHFWNYLFILSDTSVTSKDLKSFDGESLTGLNKNKILQMFGPFGDANAVLEKINLETTYTEWEEGFFQRLIIPFVFQDVRFGSPETQITHIYNWDKTKAQFVLENKMETDCFSDRVAEVQGLLFKKQYDKALEKIKLEEFYEIWNAYPGCENYYYPQNLFLDFIDYTHKYALKELRNCDTIQAAKFAYGLLNEPLFKHEFKQRGWFNDATFTVLPFLTSSDKFYQYNLNIVNPCRYNEEWNSPNWMDDFRRKGYSLLFSDSIELYDEQGYSFKAASFEFIPNDAEYTVKLNDLAYFMELGGYDSLAKVILEQIVQFHPSRTVAHLNLGDALYDLGEKSKAKQYYQNYIALCRKNKVVESKIPPRVFDRIKS